MTLQSNHAEMLAAADTALAAIAHGFASGDASIAEYYVTIADHVAAGIRDLPDMAELFDRWYASVNAKRVALGRPLADPPQGNSRASQMAKAKAIVEVGFHERKRVGLIALLRDVASDPLCQWKQKRVITAAGALLKAHKADPHATDDALTDAMMDALTRTQDDKAKTLAGEFAKLTKAWDKLQSHEDFGPELFDAQERAGINVVATLTAAMVKTDAAIKAHEAAIELGR